MSEIVKVPAPQSAKNRCTKSKLFVIFSDFYMMDIHRLKIYIVCCQLRSGYNMKTTDISL